MEDQQRTTQLPDEERNFSAALSGGGEDGYVVPEEKQKVSRTTLAFCGMAVLAAGGLYMMKMRAGPASAGAAAVTVDPAVSAARQSIQKFLAGGASEVNEVRDLLADTEAIRDKFGELSRDSQIPLDKLKTNPFWREEVAADVLEESAEVNEAYARRLAAERDRLRKEAGQRLIADASKLDVGSVLLGSRPTAQVEGAFVRVGDTVGEDMKIIAITREGIRVSREGHEALATMNR